MSERWTLKRAGILNVYQYGDETIHFAGGRLLLRGVNGSGKSTAMNMLLPYLLDGDARKIDAAGEQAGVLKSWMLAGREDPQPIGYLWIEFESGEGHLTCGSGIKANRASDSVTTWWWLTSKRVGIDFSLVEDNRPLSYDVLKAVLGSDPVYKQDQRVAYRDEVRRRLFGGADIDQHIRLLHIVRNPRVGDRIDLDLPAHLHDALPPLSETALNDAAQPLDDLEEHRKTVAELKQTAATLEALGVVYSNYARAELHRKAGDARDRVSAAERTRREAIDAERLAAEAETAMAAAVVLVKDLSARERSLDTELAALRESPAYTDGKELVTLRDQVRDRARDLKRATDDAESRRLELVGCTRTVETEAKRAAQDRDSLAGQFRDLTALAVDAGLPLTAPDIPVFELVSIDPDSGLEAPRVATLAESNAITVRLVDIRAALTHRKGDVLEVRTSLEGVDRVGRDLDRASQACADAETDVTTAKTSLLDSRKVLGDAVIDWRSELTSWRERFDEHRIAVGLDGTELPDLNVDLAGRREDVKAVLTEAADALVGKSQETTSHLKITSHTQLARVAEFRTALDRLNELKLPDPPAQAWQRSSRRAVFAELIDFRDDVSQEARRGLEAAMEAAGLLGAEVDVAGDLVLDDGTLLLSAGAATDQPLSTMVVPSTQDDDDSGIVKAVARLLNSISINPTDTDGEPGSWCAVGVDGGFRIGGLSGRHRKQEAEFVGVAARRAALARQQLEARGRLDEASELLVRTEQQLALANQQLELARALRRDLPSPFRVGEAIAAARLAEDHLAATQELLASRRAALQLAEEIHAEAVDKAARTAANLGLVPIADELRRVEDRLEAVDRLTHKADGSLKALVRSIESWRLAASNWEQVSRSVAATKRRLAEATQEHQELATRLQTIEATIGREFDLVVASIDRCEAELKGTRHDLEAAHENELACNAAQVRVAGNAEAARTRSSNAERHCIEVLPDVRRLFDVAGLLAAATEDPAALRQPREASVAGVKALASEIERTVPAPTRADTTADGVRQSLRQRRDSLGAGWDTEDRQRDEGLPLSIEITGPHGKLPLADAIKAVNSRLKELSALLTSEQDEALRNLLQGLVAREIAEKLHTASDLVSRMNKRLESITTSHGIGVSLRWVRREALEGGLPRMIELLSRPPDLRTSDQDSELRSLLSGRLDQARLEDPEAPYRDLIGKVLDYRTWYDMRIFLHRPGQSDTRLTRRTPLSEGEKKIVSYLPLFSAVAASCDSLAEAGAPDAPRFLLLDDAFAKVSEDNHAKLFGLLVQLDLDFIATSERLWGTHSSVPQLAITEVIRDAGLGVIVLEHSRWDGAVRTEVP